MIQAVLFDMDGVIVDSEEFICKASMMMFAEHGLQVKPEDFLPFVGTGENHYLSGVAEKYGFSIAIERDKARTYAIYGEIIKGELKPLPGVREFITKCRDRKLKLAIASSADRIKLEQNFSEIGIALDTTFDAVVCGSDITHKKPHPEIFLTAAIKCGVKPETCLVVEDAINGVIAAKAAGAKCLGITSSFSAHQLSKADWFASNLAGAPEECLDW
jgi:beta-phosphoglucomutase